MHRPAFRHPLLVLASALTLTFSGLSAAEPPSRAARLGSIDGTVSFSPAGQPDWVRAVVNRPLTSGDRLWTDAGSRAELQLGGAAFRLGAATSVTLLNLDDRIAQLQLAQGTLKVRVRHLRPNQSLEVATPNLAFTLRRPGDYRIEVDADDDATTVMVQSGEAEVYGEGASYAVKPRQGYRFYGTDLSDYELVATRRDDDLDRWAHDRDRRGDQSASARYVSPEVVGYEDLDSHGTWRADRDYGNVWTPSRVAVGWTPYRDGHWAWIDPWGWTWIDDAPWGFAVSHYGRWASFNGRWGWVPGPPRERAVYAPALVAFVGGSNFQVAVSVGSTMPAAVGWFPLAPREVYRPSYAVSRGYFDHINRSNAVIAPATITNVYNTTIVNNTTNIVKVVYANQQVKGAVIAVPAQAFVQSQPVAKAAMPLSREAAVSAPVARSAAVAPVAQSVHGGAPVAAARPPAREHAIVARTAPPPPPVPFAVQQKQLADTPGTPIDEAQRTVLKPAAPAAAKVSIVTTQAAPTALPPPAAPAAKSPQARKADAAKAHAADGQARSKPDVAGSASASAGASRPEASRVDTAAADAAKAAAAKADATKADATKAETAKTEATRSEAVKAETAKAETAKVEATKAETAKEAAKSAADAARVATAKAEAAKAEAARSDATKAAATKARASKDEAAQAEAARADAAKASATKAEATKAEATKADAAKAASVKAEAAKAEAAQAEATRAGAIRAAAAKADASKAEAARAETAKADATKSARATAEAAKAESERADAVKVAAAKADATKVEAAKAESAKTASAKAAAAAPPASSPRHDAPAQKPEPAVKAEDEKKKPEDEPRRRNDSPGGKP